MTPEDDLTLCQKCHKNPAEEPHCCPYAMEIHDDRETECDCCDDCADQCYLDI